MSIDAGPRPSRLRSSGRRGATAVSLALETPLAALARRGLLPRAIWARLPVTKPFTVDCGTGSFAYAPAVDDSYSRMLRWRGLKGLEPETLSVFRDLIAGATTVVDVGANRGLYTLTALSSDPDVEVVAVEASPRTAAHLRDMVRLNSWEDRCEIHEVAAGAEAGVLPFHVPPSTFASSARLVMASHRSSVDRGTVVDVPVRPVDELVASADVVKIDVEGAEHLVLAGMGRLLAESRPAVIIEVLPEAELAICEQILRDAGYSFWHLTGHGPVARDGLVADPAREYRNYLCRAE